MCRIIVVVIAVLISGCTSVDVKPLDSSLAINHVCIVENPEVDVSDFKQVLRNGFSRHGIATTIVSVQRPDQCGYVLNYTARRSWDIKPYLNLASLSLEKDGLQIAYAEYRHSGGFGLNKWASTNAKMDPVIDQLLADYKFDPSAEPYVPPSQPEPVAKSPKVDEPSGTPSSPRRDKYEDLERLKKLLDDGALTQEEYDLEKAKILNE